MYNYLKLFYKKHDKISTIETKNKSLPGYYVIISNEN